MLSDQGAMPLAFISTSSFAGIGRQAQCFAWATCHLARCSKVAFVGIGCFACQAAFNFAAMGNACGYLMKMFTFAAPSDRR